MRSPLFRQFLNIVALVAVLVVNGLAVAGVVNNKTTGELSDKYPVLTTPAGYAFSIWSLIYLWPDCLRSLPGVTGTAVQSARAQP